ncbi:MAG: hypothetical protein D6711_16990 [Chloroflexi bacterium]|nr:MAG: hypothetical protein D6711_16990 [Chloroflexota bacterium]
MRKSLTGLLFAPVLAQASTISWETPLYRVDGSAIQGQLEYVVKHNEQTTVTDQTTVDLSLATGDQVCVTVREIGANVIAESEPVCATIPAIPNPANMSLLIKYELAE